MIRFLFAMIGAAVFSWVAAATVSAAVEASLSMRIASYFSLPEAEVQIHVQAGHSDEDVARAVWVAAEAGVPVPQVLELKRKGWAWGRICNHHGLGVEVMDAAWSDCRAGRGKHTRGLKPKKPAKPKEAKRTPPKRANSGSAKD